MFKRIAACLYDVFLNKLKKTFAHPMSEDSSVEKRSNLHQGIFSMAEFVVNFWTAATAACWPESTLQG